MNVSFVFRYFRSINSSDIITKIPTPLLKIVSSESKFILLADCSSINYVNKRGVYITLRMKTTVFHECINNGFEDGHVVQSATIHWLVVLDL